MASPRLERRSDVVSELPNPNVPISVIASPAVPVERAAVVELDSFAEIADTVVALRADHPELLDGDAAVEQIVCTPDFHKGAGIPIGTVAVTRGFAIPQAVGNDVGCGMRLVATDLRADEVRANLDQFDHAARHVFFEGGRHTGLSAQERGAVIERGPAGLADLDRNGQDQGLRETATAQLVDAGRTHSGLVGAEPGTRAFESWIRPNEHDIEYDAVLGSIGGSNHFVEIQRVARILDKNAARLMGLQVGQVCVMAHSGSLSLGHAVGAVGVAATRVAWPYGRAQPRNGILPLPGLGVGEAQLTRLLEAVAGAANFAAANRFVLTLMALRSLQRAVDRTVDASLVWDAPHNLVWQDGQRFTHRKGATPAGGADAVVGGPYAALGGEPVLVPGSMGAPSWILVGTGSALSCSSACHGAGRSVPRGKARRVDDAALDAFLDRFRIITPLDVRRSDVVGRQDIVGRWRQQLAEEAPWAYKDVGPVVETLEEADVARRAVELEPIATIKA